MKQFLGLDRTLVLFAVGWLAAPAFADEARLTVERREGSVVVGLGSTELLTYVYRDPAVSRPYFAPVRTTGGIQVSRNHPPDRQQDSGDHQGLHTGIWLSFGDLCGSDFWRLKAATRHIRFAHEPMASAEQVEFAVVNHYLSASDKFLAEETCHYRVRLVPHGYLLDMTSEFRAGDGGLVFGDQEEMGLGIRVATPLSVDRRQGGRILDSAGRRDGAEVWGKTAKWCDYAGPLEGKWVGMTVLAAPDMFRPCWCHARDYGFLAMNPFGRKAFTGGEPSRVVVPNGDVLRLRYGVVVHETAAEQDYRPEESYALFADQAPRP